MSILDLPQREFLAMLPELKQQGVDTDALLRQYRSANSPLEKVSRAIFGTGLNEAATAAQAGIANEGRRIAFDPRNIRSRFARFDPEFAQLSNLSAANASPTTGLLGVSAVQEDKKELPFMNFMRGLLQ